MRISLTAWELAVSNRLRALRLDSIRNKILAFAVVATLIPSFSTAWISYIQNRRSLTEKIAEELRSQSGQAATEIDLWAQQRLIELRVFASSYEVSENLDRLPRVQALGRLTDYLNSVRERFVDYEELLVNDPQGRVVATSTGKPGILRLPARWQAGILADNPVLGEAQWDSSAGKAVMLFSVPIRTGGRLLGALTVKLNLASVQEILQNVTRDASREAIVLTDDGRLVVGAHTSSATVMLQQVPRATVRALTLGESEQGGGRAIEYDGLDGQRMVGTWRSVPRLDWAVMVEIPAATAFRQVARLRNWTMAIIAALLVVVGGLGYFLGLLIVRPLNRLTQGAAKVAAGDLAVDVPVVGSGEVAYLTEVFNDMVRRLREGREKLERLSVTDGLTGLFNRRHLMDRLDAETGRAERHNHAFSVLMVDVDHFKRYNDSHGHLAGDEVLTKVAAILNEAVREVDMAARYGGEEFAVLLPETGADAAVSVAERIRTRLAGETFSGGKVTVSVGVAEFPEHGDTAEAVMASADGALYEAKSAGRDRVVRATKRRATRQANR